MAVGALWLRHGPHEAEVDPTFGGRVTAFRSRPESGRRDDGDVDWFMPVPAEERVPGASASAGSFPLVPFSNRIRDARLRTADGEVRLAATERGKPHAIHGHGRSRDWTVEEAGPSHAVLTYRYETGDWPWPYQAWQRFTLSDEGFVIAMVLENRAATAMPAGIGLHPYLPLFGGVRLTARFGDVWPAVEDSIPAGPAPLPGDLDFTAGRDLPAGLDTGFGGWDGRARLDWPGTGRTLSVGADGPFGHCILFSPEGRDFFCLEPVSHAIDGHNLAAAGVAGTGARWLPPGERFGGMVRFRPEIW